MVSFEERAWGILPSDCRLCTSGLTRFDLLGDFGRFNWLGNFYIVFLYNAAFAGLTTLCLVKTFTAAVRAELIRAFGKGVWSMDGLAGGEVHSEAEKRVCSLFLGQPTLSPIVLSCHLTSEELTPAPSHSLLSLLQGWTDCHCLSLVFPGLLGRSSISDLQLGAEKEGPGQCLGLAGSPRWLCLRTWNLRE